MNSLRPLLLKLAASLLTVGPAAQAITCTDATIAAANPDPIYTVHGDGTVSDTRSGLMWKQCAEGQNGGTCSGSATLLTWRAALTQATLSEFAGYNDWRLPNINELVSLIEDCRAHPAINDTVFPETPSEDFWSSSPFVYYPNIAWYINFSDGYASNDNRSSGNRVRLVRAGQSFADFDRFAQTNRQTIAFDPVPSVTVGGTGTLRATASSGLAVAISSSTMAICRVSGNTLSGLAVGTCTLTAEQAGNDRFSPALPVTQRFSIVPVPVPVPVPILPDPPTLISTLPGSGSASIRFSPPSNDGGTPIARYTATCTATGQTPRSATGTTSPLTVKNLTGSVEYQCTLTATNRGGLTSTASAKQPVTPTMGRKSTLTPILTLLLDGGG